MGDDQDCNDGNGHGTHVAGTIGGVTFGVAKDVQLKSLRVCKGTGKCPRDGLIAALEKVASASGKRVVNFSLAGEYSQAVEDAKQKVLDAGAVIVVAAGNRSRDACDYSARSAVSISVGASTDKDEKATFSNYGPCVSLWAPGEDIRSAMVGGNGQAEAVLSGTSFAAPHVTGIVALQLERGVAPRDMAQVLTEQAIPDRLSDLGDGSVNLLAHMPLGLHRVETECPADMIGRECRRGTDCCEGYACQDLGLFRAGTCSESPQRATCGWRKSSGESCRWNLTCCSRVCQDRTCR